MNGKTALLKRLVVGPFDRATATAVVTLDGQPLGELIRESPGFYGALLGGRAAGGGRNIPNALRSLAVNYDVEVAQGRTAALRGEPFNPSASTAWQRAYAEALQDQEH